jgi:hypothetical protein
MTDPLERRSPRIARALEVARVVHKGAFRKGTQVPYIEHPTAVARILEAHGYAEDLVVAGLLHDTVEDARFTCEEFQHDLNALAGDSEFSCSDGLVGCRRAFLEFLSREFGDRVVALVLAVTETKNDGGQPLDWLERKKEQLDHLAQAPAEVATLKAADALHNIESTVRDIRLYGLGVLDRFRGGALTTWHYSTTAELAAERMPEGAPLAARVRAAAHDLRATVRSLRPQPAHEPRYPPPTVC